MSKTTIVFVAALLLGGCASEYKKEAQEEKAAELMPVNCKTAEGDLRMLNSEKASAAQQAAAGATAIVPIGLVAGLATDTEGTKAQIATGDYNKILDAAIMRIKTLCNIQ